MRGKLLFVVGAATGYVLGARAGRERYEQIREAWGRVWDTPAVQDRVDGAKSAVADRLAAIPGMIFAKLREALFGSSAGASRRSSGAAGGEASSTSTSRR